MCVQMHGKQFNESLRVCLLYVYVWACFTISMVSAEWEPILMGSYVFVGIRKCMFEALLLLVLGLIAV